MLGLWTIATDSTFYMMDFTVVLQKKLPKVALWAVTWWLTAAGLRVDVTGLIWVMGYRYTTARP